MAKGFKTGGRAKGTPNKATAEQRALVKLLLDKKLPELEAMIDETRFGIEIEKQIQGPNGQNATVVGRLNADPKGAAELMLKLMEFSIPKLGRIENELSGADGAAIQVIIQKYTEEE